MNAEVTPMSPDAIVVGPRLRKHLGDVSELRGSIRKHGILEPILVRRVADGNLYQTHLVAGGRRLHCATGLKLNAVPVLDLGPLTDEEARTIEREENVGRKDFTTYEASARRLREIVDAVEAIQREKLATPQPPVITKSGRARVRSTKATRKDVAERTGISPAMQAKVERHAAMVEKFPGMRKWNRGEVLSVEEALAKLPASVGKRVVRAILDHDVREPETTRVLSTLALLPEAARDKLANGDPQAMLRACKHAPPAEPKALTTMRAVVAMLDEVRLPAGKVQGARRPVEVAARSAREVVAAFERASRAALDRWMTQR